ncbi:MAG TPA: hypothetical protein VMV81_01340, partial [Phycisphaerae bacterium]|nr:hypothetical protein [Phycisphaerae bacterium]
MAKKSVGFFDQHIEKVVIGLCGLGLAAAGYLAFSGARFSVDNRGPADLARAVSDATETARTSVLSPKSSGSETKTSNEPDPTQALKNWFGDSAPGLASVAKVANPLPRTQPFPPLLPFTAESMKAEKRNLAKLPPPGPPIVLTGRSTLNFPVAKPKIGTGQEPTLEETAKPTGSTVSWVSVGCQVDLVDQQASFIAERYPPRSYYTVVKVHLQRKDESDPGKGWVDVNTYIPVEEMNKPLTADGRINMSEVRKYRSAYDFDAEAICRPTLPPRIAGDRIELVPLPFMDESPKGGPQEPGKAPPESADA